MKCSTDPGATHYQGCECSEQAHAERLAAVTRERDDLLKASKYWSTQLEASMRDLSECQKERDEARDTASMFGAKYGSLAIELDQMRSDLAARQKERDRYREALLHISGLGRADIRGCCVAAFQADQLDNHDVTIASQALKERAT